MALVALAQAVTTVAPQAEPDGDLSASRVGDELWDGEGGYLFRSPFQQALVLNLDFPEPADPRAKHNATAEGLFLGEIQARVFHGVRTGDNGVLGKTIEAFRIFRFDVSVG
jgi:hypothetical protein